MTLALAGAAKATLAATSKDVRKGRVDVDQAWQDLGGHGRYQVLAPLGAQLLPILLALPDRERVHGERITYTDAEILAVVEEQTTDVGSRLKRKAVVMARAALVASALAALPPWRDPRRQSIVPDTPEGL